MNKDHYGTEGTKSSHGYLFITSGVFVLQITTPGPPRSHDSCTMKLLAVLAVTAVTIPNPILFVTQVPIPGDFTTVASPFGNHRGQIDSAPRGGDLWIRYPDGSIKNLTHAPGFTEVAARAPSGQSSAPKA